MAIVIDYYLPQKFRKQGGKWIPPEQREKVNPVSRTGKDVSMTCGCSG
jgi:hypothetical protein